MPNKPADTAPKLDTSTPEPADDTAAAFEEDSGTRPRGGADSGTLREKAGEQPPSPFASEADRNVRDIERALDDARK